MKATSTKLYVSIIIRAKNEEKGIMNLLKYFKKQKFDKPYEIILLDSGSTDCTIEIARKNNLRIIEIPPEDFTYGYALNTGIKYAQGEIIVFISAHTYPLTSYWLKKLTIPFIDNDIKCVYGKLVGNKCMNPFEDLIWKNIYTSKSKTLFGISDYDKLAISNSNAAYRKTYLIKNHFDEKIPFSEDLLMGLRILRENFKIEYINNAMIFHTHPYKFRNNFLINVKIGYSIEYINCLFFNQNRSIISIFYRCFKKSLFDSLNFFKWFFIHKSYLGILKLISYFISRFAGNIIGKVHFFNQYIILTSRRKKNEH